MNSIGNGNSSGLGGGIMRGHMWIIAGLIVAMCASLGGAIRSARAASPAPTKTIWDGVYTDDQAARGKAQYSTSCSSCHMDDMSGSGQALPLAGDAFTDVWEGQTMADLLGLVQGTMPQDKPGSLTPEAALDVITYILQYNKYPAGKEELKNDPDALKNILITKKAPAKTP
jgi:mono/diheme cytochrome c family protein